jgi:murein DD-endopeptidase MepM/ murein hydrolase activator NlpD
MTWGAGGVRKRVAVGMRRLGKRQRMRQFLATICTTLSAIGTAQAACDPNIYGADAGHPLLRPVAVAQEIRVTERFGKTKHLLLGYTRLHGGIDFDGPVGTPVVASRGGEVIEARFKGEFGNTVMISHLSGMQTEYSHMIRIVAGLAMGGCVRRGDIIGYLGSTGLSNRPHLHFEVQLENTAIDPIPFLEKLED